MVRFLLPLLLLILLLSQPIFAQSGGMSIIVDDQVLLLKESPLVKDDQVMLPGRPLLEAMGMEVFWEEETQTVVGSDAEFEMVIPIGCSEPLVNGEPVEVDIPAELMGGCTYLPISFIEQFLNTEVGLVTESGTIAITPETLAGQFITEKISINTADRDLLQTALGIKQAIAENIIQYRESSGPFWEIKDLLKVPGVHEKIFSAIKDKVSVVFAEKGMASWYGTKFQGRRTASGEIFKQEELTAAHRDLPFGTYVNVEFPPTGKEATVRINDRGPHVRGRIIDLSRGAADAIGLRPYGVAEVKLNYIGEKAN